MKLFSAAAIALLAFGASSVRAQDVGTGTQGASAQPGGWRDAQSGGAASHGAAGTNTSSPPQSVSPPFDAQVRFRKPRRCAPRANGQWVYTSAIWLGLDPLRFAVHVHAERPVRVPVRVRLLPELRLDLARRAVGLRLGRLPVLRRRGRVPLPVVRPRLLRPWLLRSRVLRAPRLLRRVARDVRVSTRLRRPPGIRRVARRTGRAGRRLARRTSDRRLAAARRPWAAGTAVAVAFTAAAVASTAAAVVFTAVAAIANEFVKAATFRGALATNGREGHGRRQAED